MTAKPKFVEDENDIVQIMPATGYWVLTEQFDAPISAWAEPLTAWGLTRAGLVLPLLTCSDGIVDVASSSTNKISIFHESEGQKPLRWLSNYVRKGTEYNGPHKWWAKPSGTVGAISHAPAGGGYWTFSTEEEAEDFSTNPPIKKTRKS